jgi:hypothetical protein
LPPTVIEPVQDDAPLEPPAVDAELTTPETTEEAATETEPLAEESPAEVPPENLPEPESTSHEAPDTSSTYSEHVPVEEDITTEGMATLAEEEPSKTSEESDESTAVVDADVSHEQQTSEPVETSQEEGVAAQSES